MLRWVGVLGIALGCQSTPAPSKVEVMTVSKVGDGGASPLDATPKVESHAKAGSAQGWVLTRATIQPDYVARADVLAAIKAAPQRAVAIVSEHAEECSSVGGSHILLSSGPAKIHFGGHGVSLQTIKDGEVFVVGWDPKDAGTSVENRKWCVPAWTIDGRAIAVLPVADHAEGARVLAEVGK
jgi:hypothetical protein